MQITKSFDLPFPEEQVWRALSDVRLVAECLPGAALTAELGEDRYKGRFTVRVGPLAASFDGEVEIARDEAARSATVSGKGADARSSSRATGTMAYCLSPAAGGTQVAVVSTLNLAGALAQFGKAGVLQDIATRITNAFVENLKARMPSVEAAPVPPPPTAAVDAGGLLLSVLWERLRGLLQRLLGRQA